MVSSDQPAFAEAAKAALEALGSSAELLRADDSARERLASASVIVAVGPLADRIVSAAAGSRSRVVECLTPKATAARSLSVPLRPSASEVTSLVKVLLPTTHKLAVFAPAALQAEVSQSARDAGLEASFPAADEAFGSAVDRLVDAADVVWIADLSAVPNGGAALVIKRATDARKMVVGPNRGTVQQGAFFAVVPDPVAHGRAAGAAALRLLKGEDVTSLAPPSGRIVVNGALARTLAVKLPPALQRRTETVE